jgi:hypothetical protein
MWDGLGGYIKDADASLFNLSLQRLFRVIDGEE